MKNQITTDPQFAGQGVALLASLNDLDGVQITSAGISGVELRVIDQGDTPAATIERTLTVGDVIHSPRTDRNWTEGACGGNSDGYVFSYTLPAADRPEGGTQAAPRNYRVEVMITPASGEPIALVWIVPTVALLGFGD